MRMLTTALCLSIAVLGTACQSDPEPKPFADETWTSPDGAALPADEVDSSFGPNECDDMYPGDAELPVEEGPLLMVGDLIYEPSEMPTRNEPVGRAQLHAVSSEGRRLYLDPANEDWVFIETDEGVETWTYEEFGCG